MFDTYIQRWNNDINNSHRLKFYCRYKHIFEQEDYLNHITENKFRIAMSKFRLSSHELNIERGRFDGTPVDQRTCQFCNNRVIENEYHFLLVCPIYQNLRRKYFSPHFCRWPTLFKFDQLMSKQSKRSLINLSKFIYFAFLLRNRLLQTQSFAYTYITYISFVFTTSRKMLILLCYVVILPCFLLYRLSLCFCRL